MLLVYIPAELKKKMREKYAKTRISLKVQAIEALRAYFESRRPF